MDGYENKLNRIIELVGKAREELHQLHGAKRVKAASPRARGHLQEIKTLCQELRKETAEFRNNM